MPAPLPGFPPPDPLLFALLKLLAIVVQPGRAQPPDLNRIISRTEAHAVGLDETDVRALLAANYVKEWLGDGGAKPECLEGVSEAWKGAGLALTKEGLAQIAAKVGGLGPASDPPSPSQRRPQWVGFEGGGGELRLAGELLKRVRHDSLGQRRVLEAFERAGWPEWIPNPMLGRSGTNRKKALRDAIWNLNEGQNPLRVRFRVHDGGVCWEIVG